jgi:hypothetical protein
MVDPATVHLVAAGLTAALGTLVAGLAYRGGRRNDSDAMRWLAVGIVCITVGPFLVSYAMVPLLALSDAAALLGILLAFNAGLFAILYSLEGT